MSIPEVVMKPHARKGIGLQNKKNNDDIIQDQLEDLQSTKRSFILLAVIFITSTITMGLVYYNFPEIEPDEYQYITLPRNLDDAKDLGRVLSRYRENNLFAVTAGFFATYIFLQTFAIPGSIFLSILSGFLFYFPVALFLVCLCSALGASFCYLLSDLVGVRLVKKYIPDRVEKWATIVARHQDDLLNYIIFLRITPFLPNWFINITSPVLKVSLTPFFFGTFIGVLPPSFVAIQAGTTLYQLTYYGEAVSWTSILALAFFAILSILPVLLKHKLREKYE
ncbi:transmembrane protein 41B-like [Anneissia japonica]|uniref:transmembrane protein 41B-like n=1 Tax=Anneissia japonica TaxID=1529436 RepID=UPI0014256033|nr:transmembrane protein 41B-like [Anneissia japonica]